MHLMSISLSFRLSISLFLVFNFINLNAQYPAHFAELAKTEYGCSKKHLNTFVDFFEDKSALRNFLSIKKGEYVAEVGSAAGYNLGILSMIYDSLHFYAEDISTKFISKRKYHKQIRKYSRLKDGKQTCKFDFVIGSTKSTNLPAATFNKILMIASFHEFSSMDTMMEDIASKLKPGGQLIIMEAFSLPDQTIYCEDHHRGYMISEVKEIMKRHGFYMTRMRSPEGNTVNFVNCMAFEKDKVKSEKFYSIQQKTSMLVKSCSLLKDPKDSGDSLYTKRLADSLKPVINELTEIYNGFECWLKDIGLNLSRCREGGNDPCNSPSGVNVLKMVQQLYPDSYHSNYWLGVALQENKQYDQALFYMKKSLAIRADNLPCKNRINELKKLSANKS